MRAHKLTVIAVTIGGLAACASSTREVNVATGNVATPSTARADTAATTRTDTAVTTRTDTAATRTDTTATPPAAAGAAMAWTATLAPPAGAAMQPDSAKKDTTGGKTASPKVTGEATVTPGANGTETKATVRITGGTPGSSYPWHVHQGQCGNDQGIVGPATAYPPITVGQDGTGTATVTLPVATPNQGQYMVNVHMSAEMLSHIVSCGNLTSGPAR